MANFLKFSSDEPNVVIMVIDESGSMKKQVELVKKAVKGYSKSFKNFVGASSIAVSVCKFANYFYPGDFRPASEILNFEYDPCGGTALAYAIVEGEKYLMDYIKEVVKTTGMEPIATFIFLSDGKPEGDRCSLDEAREAIGRMNLAKVNTIFIPFKEAINSNFGKYLGFTISEHVKKAEEIVEFMVEKVSESTKKQSQSCKPLGVNFFSQATGKSSSSASYSKEEQDVLKEDDLSWLTDLL